MLEPLKSYRVSDFAFLELLPYHGNFAKAYERRKLDKAIFSECDRHGSKNKSFPR